MLSFKKQSLITICSLIALITPLILLGLDEVTVIDFGVYEERIISEFETLGTNNQAMNPDGSPTYVLSPDVMAISNWLVDVRSSGLRIPNIVKSQCLPVYSKLQGQTVMGVRVNFPETRQNDRAFIRPQFGFHVYDRMGNFTNLSNGVVPNVGLIKDISIWVKGRNYPFDIAARLIDQDSKLHEFFFGNLFFDNWRKLTWVNPNYIEQVKDRVIIRRPMYPRDLPHLKFDSFVIYRDMDQIGGDFILYLKNLTMRYERHTTTILEEDIDDEEVWKILQLRALENMQREHKELAEQAHDLEKSRNLQIEGNHP